MQAPRLESATIRIPQCARNLVEQVIAMLESYCTLVLEHKKIQMIRVTFSERVPWGGLDDLDRGIEVGETVCAFIKTKLDHDGRRFEADPSRIIFVKKSSSSGHVVQTFQIQA